MLAQQLRTVIITNASLVAVQAALDKFKVPGSALTAGDSGTVAYDPIAPNSSILGDSPPRVFWNGSTWTVFLFLSSS